MPSILSQPSFPQPNTHPPIAASPSRRCKGAWTSSTKRTPPAYVKRSDVPAEGMTQLTRTYSLAPASSLEYATIPIRVDRHASLPAYGTVHTSSPEHLATTLISLICLAVANLREYCTSTSFDFGTRAGALETVSLRRKIGA